MTAAIQKIRNIGIIAHIDAGKTTTTERILYYAGETHRMGGVDEGTTVTDFDPEEAARGITIYSAAVSCRWQDCTINIIDTPGHVDFTAEVERSLRVLDGGLVVFSAVEGVEAQSETVWRQADRYHVPRICFINKMDRIGAGFERVFQQIGKRLNANPIAIQIPMGEGPATNPDGLRGIIDLIEMKALYFDGDSQGKVVITAEIPAEHRDRAEEWRMTLLDTVAMYDEAAFTEYDKTGTLSADVIKRVLRQPTIAMQLQPVLCGASLDYIGVQPLLDAVVNYLPSPVEIPPVEGRNPNPKKSDKTEVRKPSPSEPFCGIVFKIHADEHSELCFIRIYSGTLKSRSRMLNPRNGAKELISQLWRVQADSKEKLDEASAGDIVGVVGPKDSVTGDTLCETQHPILLEAIRFPECVLSMAIEPDSSADRRKLDETLKLMAKQDPTFTVTPNEETGQIIVGGMGELHLDIISKRMQRDFHLKIRTHKPRVTYRETVRNAVTREGVFDRPTPNGNQFAAVTLKIEPHSQETPTAVANKIKPGAIPSEQLDVVLGTLRDELKGTGLVGYPLFDILVTMTDIRTRDGETTEAALRAATSMAFRQVLQDAGVVLLEPIMKLEVTAPGNFVGNINSDLSARRAMIVNTELRGELVVIEAEAPLAEMFGYANDVRSLSQGRASYTMEPCRFAEAPAAVVREIMGE